MNEYIKTYKVVLETFSPVYIGSGEEIGKKEYIYDSADKKVYVPNMKKMCTFFSKKGLLEKYEQYLLEDRRDFFIWLKSNNIHKKDYIPWIDYSMDSGDAAFEQKGKKGILTCMKDSYGCPYVPGSSLKGVLRTVLLATDILENKQKYAIVSNSVEKTPLQGRRSLKRESEEVEGIFYNILNRDEKNKFNAVNDIMTGLRISDSKPLSCDDIVLCQKIDVTPDGKENKLPILRECIKPKTIIEFDMEIDQTLFKITPQQILHSVNVFLDCYNTLFAHSFKRNYKKDSLFIGGGVGFMSKTVLHQILIDNPKRVKRVSNVIDASLGTKKHQNDEKLGVSPHMIKMTYCNEKKYSYGVCKISIN
ncbi:type III-A CRISPR-associated RAMP protein Csm5 [Lachnospiraceae bacterium 46-61]